MKNAKEDKTLRRAIGALPKRNPSNELWDNITAGLDKEIGQKPNKRNGWLKYVAMLALVISASLIWYNLTSVNSELRFDEEVSQLISGEGFAESANREFESFLEQECSEYRDLCEMPQFKMLISELTAVEVEVSNIAVMIETTGYDEYLYKARTKADQEAVRIKKALVKLLRG